METHLALLSQGYETGCDCDNLVFVQFAEHPIEHQFHREKLICCVNLTGCTTFGQHDAFLIYMTKSP